MDVAAEAGKPHADCQRRPSTLASDKLDYITGLVYRLEILGQIEK